MAAGSRWDEFFRGRTWRVATEVTGQQVHRDAEGRPTDAVVRFEKGRFEIDGGVFHSPLSSARGSRGVLLQEIRADGTDIAGSRVAVGASVLRRARNDYQAVR